MKKILMIILIFPTFLSANNLMDDRELSLIDPKFEKNMYEMIAALEESLGPTKELDPKCLEITQYGGGEICKVDGKFIISCSENFKNEVALCFNGNIIAKTSPNILMMNYLCSDTEFFGPPLGLHLGTCNPEIHKELLKVEEKVSCHCNSEIGKPPGWVCFNKDPEK